jgi:hypothetical protein
VFGAALQQAQELADASIAGGYATRPLTLFYCFSQGLRAVSAASVEDGAWRVHGHGAQVLTAAPILQTSINPKPSLRADSRDALSAVHAVAHAEPMCGPMRLGAVWAAAPDSPSLPDEIDDAPSPLRLHLPPGGVSSEHAAGGRIEVAVEGLSVDLSDDELQTRLTAYPSMAGATSVRTIITEHSAGGYRSDRAQVVFAGGRLILSYVAAWLDTSPVLTWSTGGDDEEAYLAKFNALAPTEIEGDKNTRIVFPAIGGVDAPEFIALWWVLLLALSSLTRYEPALWTSAIEPDSSKLAVPIEKICDFAETFVPTVLFQMLTAEPG